MWWLDPGKEVLNVLFNRILAPYVENLDMNQVNYGIGQGQLTLHNLRLKKGALDKFRLPVDILEGYLGTFTLSLHWMNLGNQPVEILIENVYLLVIPSSQGQIDPEEEEQRAQAAKMERLANTELLHMHSETESADDSPQSKGLWASLTAKIINNLQVTVKNIHVRYEDEMSVPGHPFAAGITLAGFAAVSVNENWEAAFIESTAGAIHKLANLQSLALYFDTDSQSMAGLPLAEAIKRFSDLISQGNEDTNHQFILKPVSGEGRIVMHNKLDKETPRFDVQLLFNEIAVALDDNQYRDAISLVDMYHFYLRQHQYHKYRPSEEDFATKPARSRLIFAGKAILEGIRERNQRWTWPFFEGRRNDRNTYVDLFQRKVLNSLAASDTPTLQALEKKLSYEDIRFYRSIARSRLRKDQALRKKLEEDKRKQQSQTAQGWIGWLWTSSRKDEGVSFGGTMTAEQRKELYAALDYDEKTALVDSLQPPRDALKACITAKLKKGSFTLRSDPHGNIEEIVSVIFTALQADVIQRPDNLETSVTLGGLQVLDGTSKNTLYPQIVQVKDPKGSSDHSDTQDVDSKSPNDDPFFFVKFENKPLDDRADTALTVRMRHMEIIYHKGFVEAVYRFFKPPASQLESVEALLNVASETLEGFRKDTRAGLEHALQTHKTIDVQMDMNAPVIIIPEDITTNDCKHLVVDAGHIAIESDLVDKRAVREIQAKRKQKYNEEDYKRLESLMYDKLSLRLEAAQFLVGNDLQSCREALASNSTDSLHLLERTNIDLQVYNSIVPGVLSLARFKVSGELPTLQVNLSDTKYKSLMRLIDVCIPNFDNNTGVGDLATPAPAKFSPDAFRKPSRLFGLAEAEYNIEDEGNDSGDGSSFREEQYFEADDGSTERPDLHQNNFEFNFQVHQLRASLSKSNSFGIEKPLGDVSFERFALMFAQAKFDMRVDINLRSLSMNLVQQGSQPIKFISSADGESPTDKDLLSVVYRRVDKASPEFATVYESINQSVDIRISTFIFRAAPEPVLNLYDFVMTTFVPPSTSPAAQYLESGLNEATKEPSKPASGGDKICVSVKLASVQVMLINEQTSIATLSLSTAGVAILLHSNTMRITGRLGSLTLSSDSEAVVVLPEFKQMMSIEGANFAEFCYETFDPQDESYTGIKSSISLNAGSVKFQFLDRPLHDIYLFMIKLAKLKGLYDAATQVAVQRASELERVQFDVSVKSPILVFPSDAANSRDVLVMRLGEIKARNASEVTTNKTTASLRGIQLTSTISNDGAPLTLKIIDDIDIFADIVQTSGIDRTKENDFPDTQISINISDVKLHLTQVQYIILLNLSQSIPLVLAIPPEYDAPAEPAVSPSPPTPPENLETLVDLEPELRTMASADGSRSWTTIDLVVTVNAVQLHMYDALATTESNLKEHGIAEFALNHGTLRLKMLSDGAQEAQLVLKSFTMSNTRPGCSKFREIIPAAQHDRNQFMLLYTMSGGPSGSALAILTVDSPQVIFALDPVFALLAFFTPPEQHHLPSEAPSAQNNVQDTHRRSSTMDFRVELHDVSLSVLEDDTDPSSPSIKLSINQILLSQQGVLALTIDHLGMSLMRMGKASESVRFLDDVDLTLSLDSRASSAQQMTSIDVAAKPIVFRVSYRDINMISAIINKAILLHGNTRKPTPSVDNDSTVVKSLSSHGPGEIPSTMRMDQSQQHAVGKSRVLMSKEQLKGSFDGFRLVLIGDMHEQPMFHLMVKPFIARVQDWSADLHATTTMETQISYWNLTNSHWEPLLDPWTFTISVANDASSGTNLMLSSRERLDLNLSTTFAELVITTLNMWSKEGERVLERARGSYAPYRIRNRTGSSVFIWSDIDGSSYAKDRAHAIQIANEESLDWRFDDWKTMREAAVSGQHTIGVQFLDRPWEPLRSIPVDREGEYTFSLRPRIDKYPTRLLCEVRVENNIKVVTIRSTYKIENHTFYPLELMLVNDSGHPVSSLEKLVPGQDYSLPLGAVDQNRIKLQPDQGFGYKWCPAIRCDDLISQKSFTIKCPHTDPQEAAFRFQAWVETGANDDASRKYPRLTLKLRAPLEIENLLPYNLQCRIYDKNADQNWKSYLRKGGIMPVHSVELKHLVLLNVDIEDTVFKPSDFAIISTDKHSNFNTESRLTLRDAQERKLDLKLNYVRYPNSGGAFKVQIYSPYLVVNKTGLPFAVKSCRSTRAGSPQDVAGDNRTDVLSRTTPFMLSHPQDRGHEYIFKLGDSAWSKLVSFEAPAAETELVLPSQTQKLEELHIGLSWTEGLGKYKLTKVITLAPRFLIKNNLSEAVCYREHGVPPRDGSVIQPGERCPLYFMRTGQDNLLTVAYPGLNTQWSPPINIGDIGSVHLRLRNPNIGHPIDLIRADLKIEGSTIFVNFSRADEAWPFAIENDSAYEVALCQTDLNRNEPGSAAKSKIMYNLKPHSNMPYAWDYPAAKEKKILLVINGARRAVDIKEIGDLVPFKFTDNQRNRAVSLDVRAEGHKQVLRITNYNPDHSLYKLKSRNSGSVIRQDTISGTAEAFEAITEEVAPSLAFSIEFAGIGVSLINRKLVEVVYISMDTLKFEYTNSAVAQTVNLACGTLQIDNQLHEALYPVILQPTPIANQSSTVAALPTVQGSVIWLKDQEHGVIFIKYCSILLQALTIETDEDLLFAIYDLTQIKGASWEDETENVLIQHLEDIPEPRDAVAGEDLYFEILELQPIKLSLSFMRTERVNSDEKLSIRNPLAVVVNVFTMTLGNINDAPLELNALAIKDMRLTLPELQNRITYHYRQDVLRQLYRILGSADFIGNPVGLFTNVSSGVADIFYEPFNGVVMHGNRELGIGIAKGAASFVKKTVFGLSDSMTKFTSSVGKGLSAATLDSEYQAKRRMTQRRNRPRHAIYGVTAGGEALASSVASAMEGVLMKPIEGAESEGALGFFKGVGKGLVGAVTKPVVGVFDLASNVSEGIRNTTTVFDSPQRDRVRLPRLVPADGILRPYSAREALGQYWMKDLDNGAYRRETYVAHIDTPGGDNVVLLTSSRVLSFWSKKLRLDWDLPFTEVQMVTADDTGIQFVHKAGRGYNKFIFIPDKFSRSWFFDEVALIVKSFNVRRRMDV